MILDFGYVSMELHVEIEKISPHCLSRHTSQNIGGRGINQALAATRTGAKVSLASAIGNDLYGKTILEKLHLEGITTSAVAKCSESTGSEIHVRTQDGKRYVIMTEGANVHASPLQIPPHALNVRTLLLLQTDMPESHNLNLLQRAREGGAKTLINAADGTKISPEILRLVNFFVITESQAAILLGTQMPSAQGAQTLARQYDLCCIIINPDGSSVCAKGEDLWDTKIAIKNGNIADVSGTEDSFCGTFAACIQAGFAPENAIQYASAACILTHTRGGTSTAFPYLGDIESLVKKTPDAA